MTALENLQSSWSMAEGWSALRSVRPFFSGCYKERLSWADLANRLVLQAIRRSLMARVGRVRLEYLGCRWCSCRTLGLLLVLFRCYWIHLSCSIRYSLAWIDFRQSIGSYSSVCWETVVPAESLKSGSTSPCCSPGSPNWGLIWPFLLAVNFLVPLQLASSWSQNHFHFHSCT